MDLLNFGSLFSATEDLKEGYRNLCSIFVVVENQVLRLVGSSRTMQLKFKIVFCGIK